MFALLVVLSIIALITWLLSRSPQNSVGTAPSASFLIPQPPLPQSPPVPRPPEFTRAAASKIGGNGQPSKPASTGHCLDAQKTIRAFDFILKSFGQRPAWSTPEKMDDYIHDLSVMLDEGDLQAASLELVGVNRTVLYRHRIAFRRAEGRNVVDTARGVELPVIPADRIARYRMLISPVSRLAVYRHRLRCGWENAERLADRPGSRFASEHTQRVNGGRMTGQVFVSEEARRTARIITVSPAGDYAFARDPAFPVDVYLHRSQCDGPMVFQVSTQVSFIAIQSPRGIQGRSIRQVK